MILVNCCLYSSEGVRYFVPSLRFHGDLPSFVSNHDVVFKESGSVLRDGVERSTQRRKGGSVGRVCMTHGDDVLMHLMYRSMKHKTRTIDRVLAFNDHTVVVGANQVGNLYLGEMDGHRIRPVEAGILRVANGQVTGKAVVESLLCEGATSPNQTLFEMLAFGSLARKLGDFRINETLLLRLVDGDASVRQKRRWGLRSSVPIEYS